MWFVNFQVANFAYNVAGTILNFLKSIGRFIVRFKIDRAIFTSISLLIVGYLSYKSTLESLQTAPHVFRNIGDYRIKCQKMYSQRVILDADLKHYIGRSVNLHNSVCYIVYKKNDLVYTYSELVTALRGTYNDLPDLEEMGGNRKVK